MAITTKESILKVLSAYNPWWKTGMGQSADVKNLQEIRISRIDEAIDGTADHEGRCCG